MVQLEDYLIKLAAELPGRFDYARKLRGRFVLDELTERVEGYLEGGKTGTVLLPGLRGTGKTTLLGQLYFYILSKTSEVIYIPVDELSLLGFSLYEAIEKYIELFRPERPVILLDEVHYDKKWDLTLKVLHDRMEYFIIATGSSALRLKESPDLARRARHIEVKPLTFLEYLHLRGEKVERIGLEALFEFDEDLLRKALWKGLKYGECERYLRVGSLPVALELPEREAYEAIFTLVERIVYRDLKEVRNFDASTLDSAMRLLFVLANPKGERFSYERLSKTLGVSKSTVMELVRAFVRSGLLIEIPPAGSLTKKVRKSPKLKFLSPSMRASILNKFESVDEAALLEDAVALYLHSAGRLEYDPGKGGADFLLIRNGKRYVIEVGLGKDDRSQVKKSIDRLKAEKGIVIGREFEVGDDILMIPWWSFLALV